MNSTERNKLLDAIKKEKREERRFGLIGLGIILLIVLALVGGTILAIRYYKSPPPSPVQQEQAVEPEKEERKSKQIDFKFNSL